MSRDPLSGPARAGEPIAIIGIGFRFPGGANDAASFWELLTTGVDAITEIPPDRWSIEQYYHPAPAVPGKTYSRWGGFLEGIDQFEPECFGISPREASHVDPQQRLLLEVAWEALEDGGQVIERLAGTNTGIFVGISTADYAQIQASLHDARSVTVHSGTGGAGSIAANRISYCLNLRGPSIAVDTACSSSLVATHLACQSLRNHECDLALAGGVNIIIVPGPFIAFCAASMLSQDGRCKAFDARADGFVRSEGAGLVVLKPLFRALADGDPVYAVIMGSAVNQDGRTSGIAMPSQAAQEALLEEACRQAGIAPSRVQYVEAHGTGTAVGDPIEAKALGTVLSRGRPGGQYCAIGSVKTNIGHLEAGAGIAGVIKAALMLKHRMLPPSVHFRTPNSDIPFEELQLRVVQSLEPWPDDSGPAIAGVNSFGFGGTNAHVVMMEHRPGIEAPTPMAANGSDRAWLLPLSARSPDALQALVRSYRDFLGRDGEHGEVSVSDLCYTAAVRRMHFGQRLSLVVNSREELLERLEAFLAGERRPGISTGRRLDGRVPKLVFVFCGQGPQWWGMGRELLANEPVFRGAIEACDALLRRHATWSLHAELAADEARSRLQETAIAQPAIFALQVALAALWKSWGIEPDAVIGHSVGEIAASHIAGALSLEEAVRVIFHRGRCMDLASSKGGMLAVGCSMPEAERAVQGYGDRVSLAALNSPSSVTLSGDPEALEELSRALSEQGVFCRFLRVNYAFHSAHMEPVREELLRSLESLDLGPTALPMISTVTGEPVDGRELDNRYWWRNVRERVRFAEAVDWLIAREHDVFVELSPHPAVSGSVAECLQHGGRQGGVLPSLRRQEEERATMLASLGSLYCLGYPVDWQKLWPGGGRCVPLPKYPWQRQRYWHESEELRQVRLSGNEHPLLGRRVSSADPSWEAVIDKRLVRYLEDHKIEGHAVFPAAACVEMALAAARKGLEGGTCILEQMQFQSLLFLLDGDGAPTVRLTFYPADGSFAIYSRTSKSDQAWTLHAGGYLRTQQHPSPPERVDPEAIKSGLPEEVMPEDCYGLFAATGIQFGPGFRGMRRLWRKDGEALGQVRLPHHLEPESSRYAFHPALLDSCLQVLGAAIPRHGAVTNKGVFLPVQIERARFYRPPGRQVWSHVHLKAISASGLEGDIRVYEEDGSPVMEFKGFRCVKRERGDDTDAMGSWFYEVRWQHKPRPEQPVGLRSAGFLPRPSEIARAVADEVRQLDDKIGWSRMLARADEALATLAVAYIVRAFHDLGWNWEPEDRITVAGVTEQLGVAARYERYLRRFLQILESAGYVKDAGADAWVVARVPREQEPQKIWQRTLSEHPAFLAELSLLGRCGSQLAAVLRGEIEPLEIIFPGGSTATAEHLYQDAPTIRPWNLMVQKAVSCALGRLPGGRTVRILEIGAGTGGVTAYVVPRLPGDRAQYVFSDVTQLFLTKAEQKFRDYPFLQFQILDIEQDPLEQGYEPHSFDLILASDVLHATASLRDTLGRCLRLLSSEGLLILLEGEREMPSNHLIFGLLEGWWRFRDYDLRSDHPLVRRATWKGVLEEVGFTDVANVSLPQDSEECVHVVMLARGPRIREGVERVVPPPAVQAPAGEKGRWLIFADGGGVAEELVELLAFHGEACLRARPGGGFRRIDDEDFEVCPDDRGDMERLLEVAVASRPGTAWRGAIHLWSLDTPPPDETSLGALQRAEVLGCHSVMHFLQALHRIERVTDSPRLLLVTRGAQPVGEATEPVAIAQSTLLGLGRVIINEHPDIRCKLVDLGPCDDPEEIQSLLAELETDDPEEEVALRRDARFVPRVARAEPERAPARRKTSAGEETTAFRLELSTPGVIDSLTLSQAERRRPGRGQVEIEVCAAALNFRDIMKVLRLYPADDGDEMLLGDECAGRIVALGEGVEGLHIGDEVIAMTPGSFGSHVTAPAGLVMRKPERLTFEEAVTMPAAFLTASYALHHLARLRRGERVLIHAATGGVGLAALQIARHLGAEIFATAGSPEKRELLRLLGVQHVMDSRSLAFADQVMEITGGRGVDVVLNSLAGQALAKGVSCLAPFGRFLELGKRDLYQNSKLGLWGLRKGASFFAVDVSLFAEAEDHAVARSLLDELSRHIQEGTFHPLPHRVFPVSRAVDAFRHMAQARHVGKVVISMQEGDALVREVNEKTIAFRPDRTYLITGGFGGLGLTVAGWIIDHGGRNVVLMSRGGAASPEARKALERLREAGARVVAVAGDVSSERQVADALAAIDGSMPPLGGIFHAAMVLDDGVLLQLDRERFRKVMAPKADGAWNLHAQTLDRPLDHFVLFSSFTGLVGNPGQGNYVAASAFLDAFAHYRRSLGRPAITINWGAVAEAGYVARHAEISRLMERRGITALSLEQAMEALGCILRKNPAQLGVIRTNWQQGAGFAKVPRRLSALVGAARIDEHRGEEGSGIRDALAQGNPEEREAIGRTYVREQVARVLGASPGTLEVDRPLGELGLDSLMGVELRNRVESDLALSLSVRELMQNPTINSLARALVERLAGRDAASAGTPTTETSQPGRRQRGPSMSGLVPLRAQGMRPPLFCIHPAGGHVSIYKHLVEMLPTDQPVYGIQSRLNAGFDEEHDSIEDMAIEYARVIRQQQASGGVHLLGFSVGGFIAMAVANVLERQGQHLGFVGLVDCDFAWAHPSYPKRQVLQNIIMETYGLLERELGVLRPLAAERLSDEAREVSEAILLCGMDERVEAVITWLTEQKHIEEDIPYGTMTQYLSGFFRRFEIHTSLISKFEPRMIRAPVSIWWAREGLSGTRQAERHWGMYTSGGVVEGTIEGSHYAVMYPPAVSTLAAELDKSLRGVQG